MLILVATEQFKDVKFQHSKWTKFVEITQDTKHLQGLALKSQRQYTT